MTVQIERRSTTSHPFRYLCLALMVVGLGWSLAACGGDDVEATGELVDVTITPEAGYPDVEIEVALSIVPDDGVDADDYGWNVEFGDGNSRAGDGIEGSAQHAFDAAGEYTIVVDALFNDDIVDTMEFSYPVYDPTSLSVDSVRAQPANVLVGENATISFDVQNETAGPVLTPFTVRAYLADSSELTREDFDGGDLEGLSAVGEQRLEADDGEVLSGGQVRNISVTAAVPDIASGDYYAIVVLDPDRQLQTTNPEQTIASSPSTIQVENIDQGLPNIDVDDLEVLPDRAFPALNQVTRAFSLANIGGEDVFNVVYETYLQVGSPQRDETAQLIHTSDPVNLPVHDEVAIGPDEFVLAEPIIPPVGQELEVYVIVEAFSQDGDVEEATQTNNVISSEPIIVSDEPVDGPDIAVHDFSITPDSTYLGGPLELEVTIANEGTQDVPSFFCGIYMNPEPQFNFQSDPQLSTVNVLGLDAGEDISIDREFSVPALYDPGIYYMYIVCDPVGAIDQPFRGNSQAMQLDPIQITDDADIDLYVQSVNLPDAAEDGETITVDATICVSGTNSTGTTTGELYTNSGQVVDFEDAPYKSFELPNINPGECLEHQLEVVAECADFNDELSVGIFVDSEGALPEEDTSNNQGVSESPVTLEGIYCECIEDDFGPNQSPQSAYLVDPEAPQPKEGALCQANQCDFYTVVLNEGDSLLIDTEHDSDRGQLETALFAPGGVTQLDLDNSETHQQVGVFNASSDGLAYIFSVCGSSSSTRNYYDFSAELIAQPSDVDVLPRNIRLPPQDSFSIGSILDVSLRIHNIGQEVSGDFEAQLILTQSRDEEALGGPEDITLATVTVDSLSAGTHRDLTLEAPLSAQIDDGDYYIAVVLDPAEVLNEQNRDNNIGFSPEFTVETACYDAFSPNDSFAQATPINSGSFSNLVACEGSSDYYEICVPDAHSMTATVDGFDPANGDIDIILYNQSLDTIDSSAQTGVSSEQVGVDYVDGAQCYYLRVFLVSLDENAESSYSLHIDTNEVDPELQCNSTFEPNDDFQTASSLWSALDYEGVLDRCPKDDVDIYTVQLSPASTVDFSASLDPSDQPGTLRLQLYRPNQMIEKTVETAPGIPTAEINDYSPPTTGTYYLQVSVTGDEHRVTYSLDTSGLPGVDLAAENLNIGSGTYVEGDQIRYDFDLLNYGGDSVSNVEYHVYIGDAESLDTETDQFLGEFTIDTVEPDDLIEIEGQVNLPSGVDEGTNYFHVTVDPDDVHDDVNLNNNTDTVPIEVVAGEEENGEGDNGGE